MEPFQAGQLHLYQRPLFGAAASDSTAHRTLATLGEAALGKLAEARRRVRRHVWSLLRLRPGGFPWLTVAGRRLTGWIIIGTDPTTTRPRPRRTGPRREIRPAPDECLAPRSTRSQAVPGLAEVLTSHPAA